MNKTTQYNLHKKKQKKMSAKKPRLNITHKIQVQFSSGLNSQEVAHPDPHQISYKPRTIFDISEGQIPIGRSNPVFFSCPFFFRIKFAFRTHRMNKKWTGMCEGVSLV